MSEIKGDEVNEKVREEWFAESKPSDNGPASPLSDIILSDRGSELQLDFDYAGNSSLLELIISDSTGVAYITIPKTRIQQGHNTLSIPVSGLPAGEYALFLIQQDMRWSVKFIHR